MRGLVLPWEARSIFTPGKTLGFAALALALAGVAARIERADRALGAADRSLGFALGVVLPLAAAAAVLHLSGGANLRELGAPAARYGADRRAAVLRAWLATATALALLGALLSVVTLVAARGGDGYLLADLGATIPVALSAALAYSAWMAAGACFGSRGAGVLVAFLFDWLAGATPLPVALATPRGHTRYLLGLEGAFDFPTWVSFVALLGLTIGAALVVALRTPR